MAFCINCGEQLIDDAKFCHKCGKAVNVIVNTYMSRNEEYAGTIIKCPVCGQELKSTDAICPACGHEVNEARVHPVLERFIKELNACEVTILQEESRVASLGKQNEKSGFSTWTSSAKTLWVILNCFMLCVPLVIYYVATKDKNNNSKSILVVNSINIKVGLIENFQVPNEREAIIAALNFIRGKVITLTSQKIKKDNWRWLKLWIAKARQINKQALEILPDDVLARSIFRDIELEIGKTRKSYYTKMSLVTLAIVGHIIIVCCFYLFLFHLFANVMLKFPDFSSTNDYWGEGREEVYWKDIFLNEYFPEPVLANAYIWENSKEECRIGDITCTHSQYYEYCRQCKEWGYDYEIMEEDDRSFEAFNSDGFKVELSLIGNELSIDLSAPMKMEDFEWPKTNIGKLVPVPKSTHGKIIWEHESGFVIYVGNMSRDDFIAYTNSLKKSGFTKDVNSGEDYFYANNKKGYHISTSYEGFNIIWIRIDAPKD